MGDEPRENRFGTRPEASVQDMSDVTDTMSYQQTQPVGRGRQQKSPAQDNREEEKHNEQCQ